MQHHPRLPLHREDAQALGSSTQTVPQFGSSSPHQPDLSTPSPTTFKPPPPPSTSPHTFPSFLCLHPSLICLPHSQAFSLFPYLLAYCISLSLEPALFSACNAISLRVPQIPASSHFLGTLPSSCRQDRSSLWLSQTFRAGPDCFSSGHPELLCSSTVAPWPGLAFVRCGSRHLELVLANYVLKTID